MKPLCAVVIVIASCGGVSTKAHKAERFDPCWCYTDKRQCEAEPCQSLEDFAACYLDAEQREAVAHGSPDTRPSWCFTDAGMTALQR